MAVRAPRVNDKRTDVETGERKRFASAILPAWARKSAQVAEVLPLLYLHGLSSGDFAPALGQFLGSVAGHDHPDDDAVARRRERVQQAFAGRDRQITPRADTQMRHEVATDGGGEAEIRTRLSADPTPRRRVLRPKRLRRPASRRPKVSR